MKKVFSGTVTSYTQQLNVEHQIKRDLPATLSLAIGAGHHLAASSAMVFGVLERDAGGRAARTAALTVLSLIGVSTPVFFLGALLSSTTSASRPASSRTAAT